MRALLLGAMGLVWLVAAVGRGYAGSADLGDGLVVRSVRAPDGGDATLEVARGDVRVPIAPELPIPDVVMDIWLKPTPAKDAVDVSFVLNCQGKERVHFTRDALLAMTEAARGRQLVATGALGEARAALERAVALAPDVVGYRLETVRLLLAAKEREAAVATLAATPARAQVAVSADLRADAALAPLADAPPIAAWRRGVMGTARGLPAYDPARGVIAVAFETGNAMAEGVGSSGVALLDAATGKKLYQFPARRGGPEGWLPLLIELGFDAPLERLDALDGGNGQLAGAGLAVACGAAVRVKAGRVVVGESRRPCWVHDDGTPAPRLALFRDVLLVVSTYNIGDGCGAHLGSWFVTVPLEKPGPPAWQALVAADAARRALAVGALDEARAALATGPADAPLVAAWRALVAARAGDVAAAGATLAALPWPWGLAAAYDPAAPPGLADVPALAAGREPPGTATSLPAWHPTRKVLAVADPQRPGAVRFLGADGAATVVPALAVGRAFLAASGFVAPLAAVAPHGAADGDWRAVTADASVRLVCDAGGDVVLSRGGRAVATGKGACRGADRPERVWIFDGAAAFVATEPAYGRDEEARRPVVRALFAR